jgi:hypothetical protein
MGKELPVASCPLKDAGPRNQETGAGSQGLRKRSVTLRRDLRTVRQGALEERFA